MEDVKESDPIQETAVGLGGNELVPAADIPQQTTPAPPLPSSSSSSSRTKRTGYTRRMFCLSLYCVLECLMGGCGY